jgi:limonene-1,2-epoxide hydrolase
MKKRLLLAVLISMNSIGLLAQSTEEVADKYLVLYTSKQFDAMKGYYTDQSTFQDPTMSFFDQESKYETLKGSDNIIAFLKDGFASISKIDFQVQNNFAVGVINYSYGILKYKYTVDREGKTKVMDIALPLAIILEIKDGKVIRHQDIADYNEYYKQYKEQLGN